MGWDRMLVDAPSLVYRAFFALPKTITDAQNRPVNAVRGFMEMATRLLVDHRPGEIVAVFDADWRPARRVAIYPGYKAERPDEPVELTRQFDLLAEVLQAAGMACVEAPGLEADDALATLVRRKPAEERVAIVSGDRDLLALVRDPDVRMLYPVKGVRGLKELDEAAVEESYKVPPRLYRDFAILRGDPSDGLPGIAGIGPVRAAQLLKQFGSIEGILEAVHRLPRKLGASFADAESYLMAMREVVTLIEDADLEQTEAHAPDEPALKQLAERHNLGSSAARLAQALRGDR